jgi:hypothetical protein
MAGTANRRISNVEPQNFEGWFRFAQSFFKIDRSTQKLTTGRIHPFDIQHSLFDIRFFRISFSIRLAAFQASGGADPPAEHLKPMLGEGFTTPDNVQKKELIS